MARYGQVFKDEAASRWLPLESANMDVVSRELSVSELSATQLAFKVPLGHELIKSRQRPAAAAATAPSRGHGACDRALTDLPHRQSQQPQPKPKSEGEAKGEQSTEAPSTMLRNAPRTTPGGSGSGRGWSCPGCHRRG